MAFNIPDTIYQQKQSQPYSLPKSNFSISDFLKRVGSKFKPATPMASPDIQAGREQIQSGFGGDIKSAITSPITSYLSGQKQEPPKANPIFPAGQTSTLVPPIIEKPAPTNYPISSLPKSSGSPVDINALLTKGNDLGKQADVALASQTGDKTDITSFAENKTKSSKEKLIELLLGRASQPYDFESAYKTAREEAGIPGLAETQGKTKKQIDEINTMLENLQGNIEERTQNIGLTEAQKQRVLASEKAPLLKGLSPLEKTYSTLKEDITGKESLINTMMGLREKSQTGQTDVLKTLADIENKDAELGVAKAKLPTKEESALNMEKVRSEVNKNNALAQAAIAKANSSFSSGIPDDTGFQVRGNLTAVERQKIYAITTGEKLVNQVEQLYADAVGREYEGVGSGAVSRVKGLARYAGSVVGANQAWTVYERFLDSNRAGIAKGIKGEVGNLAENEQENALKSFPGRFSSPYEAQQAFTLIKQQMKDQKGNYGKYIEGGSMSKEDLQSYLEAARFEPEE